VTPKEARAFYQKRKKMPRQKQLAIATSQSKADTRARSYLERVAAGETHRQIADSLGVSQCSVTTTISRYYDRHPHLTPEGVRQTKTAIVEAADRKAEQILEMQERGMAIAQIERELGLRKNATYNCLKHYFNRHPHLKKETADV
jgi:DNA-binding NarL/FixJ family response regulator